MTWLTNPSSRWKLITGHRKLGEVCDFQNGLWKGKKPPFKKVKVLRNTNFRNGGYLDLSNVAEIEVEKKQLTSRLLEKGDLILERSGGGPTQPVGRVVYFEADGEFSFSNFTTRIRVRNPEELYDKYLWRYLNQLYISGATETMQKQTTGIRNLNFSEYKNLDISLPPIGEQRKIVEKIEKLFAKIDEIQKLRREALDVTKALQASILHEVFDMTRERERESRWRAWEWPVRTLSEIAEITSGGTPSRDNASYYRGNIAWLKSGELNDNQNIEDSEEHITEDALENSNTKIFPTNTLLLAMYGATAGKLGILGKPAATNQAVAGIRVDKKKAITKFLFYFLLHHRGEIIARAWGGAQPNISQRIIKEIKILLPPLAEQKKIVARLDSLSKKIGKIKNLQSATQNDFVALEQSVLSKAFNAK